MKTNTTKNLASVAMMVIVSPILVLAGLVSIKTAGVVGNDVLLVLLILSGAVLSGINGFGRRTGKVAPLSSARDSSTATGDGRQWIRWSSRPSTNP